MVWSAMPGMMNTGPVTDLPPTVTVATRQIRRPSTSWLMLRLSAPILLMNIASGSMASFAANFGLTRMTFSQTVLDMGSGASASQPLLAWRPSPEWTLGRRRTSSASKERAGAAKALSWATPTAGLAEAKALPARTPSASQAAKASSVTFFERALKVSRTSACGSLSEPAKGARTSSSVTVANSGSIIGWTGT